MINNIPTQIDEVDDKYLGIIYPGTDKEQIVASEYTYERCERVLRTKVKALIKEQQQQQE